MFGNTGEKNGGEEMSRSEMRRLEKTNRTFAKLVLTAVILFLLIIAAEHGTMTVLAEEPAVYGTKTAVYESVKVGEGEDLEIIAESCERGELSREAYIETLRRINGLHGSRIHRGCWIAVVNYR